MERLGQEIRGPFSSANKEVACVEGNVQVTRENHVPAKSASPIKVDAVMYKKAVGIHPEHVLSALRK